MARRTAKKTPDLTTTDDGLLLREVGDWSKEKLHYVARYMDIFTTSMREKWILVYADLFAGPGKSRIRDTGEVIKGSPLLALDLVYRFNKYIFVEAGSELLKALEERIAPYRDKVEIKSKEADCNAAAKKIVSLIPSDSLALAFIDPEGCDIHFATIKALAASRRVDLLMRMERAPIQRAIGWLQSIFAASKKLTWTVSRFSILTDDRCSTCER